MRKEWDEQVRALRRLKGFTQCQLAEAVEIDFTYLSKDTQHSADLIAINPQAQKIAIANVTVTQIERKYLSVLTKQNNGTYKYESKQKEVDVAKTALDIPATGGRLILPTQSR